MTLPLGRTIENISVGHRSEAVQDRGRARALDGHARRRRHRRIATASARPAAREHRRGSSLRLDPSWPMYERRGFRDFTLVHRRPRLARSPPTAATWSASAAGSTTRSCSRSSTAASCRAAEPTAHLQLLPRRRQHRRRRSSPGSSSPTTASSGGRDAWLTTTSWSEIAAQLGLALQPLVDATSSPQRPEHVPAAARLGPHARAGCRSRRCRPRRARSTRCVEGGDDVDPAALIGGVRAAFTRDLRRLVRRRPAGGLRRRVPAPARRTTCSSST